MDRVVQRITRANDSSPTQIGRFAVHGKLGEGGMGTVYLGYDAELGRNVAIKLLRSRATQTIGALRLVREAQGLAKLSHPNVVAVHEIGEVRGSVFVAMEYVEGHTLRDWLDAQPRSWREVLNMLRQAGRGLEAAHQAGLVHRDFKPRNVIVGNDQRVRVFDFGLVRETNTTRTPAPPRPPTNDELELELDQTLGDTSTSDSGASALTRSGILLGTPAYMSPEQLRSLSCDALSDQFSFCISAYEALFGHRPFRGDTLADFMTSVCGGMLEPVPPDSPVPLRVQQAVLRGLSIDPGDRWPSMTTLLEELDAVVMMLEIQTYLEHLRGQGGEQPDVEHQFQVADGPYGRAAELDALAAAFERTRLGSRTQFVFVSGVAGVGKSTLISDLRPFIEQQGGMTCSGQFDAQRRTPLAGMIEALEDLVLRFERLGGSSQADLPARLAEAVGRNAALLIELVPAVARLLGDSPAVAHERVHMGDGRTTASVSPERLNRMHVVVERLLGALSTTSRPLVLFVEDLHWADDASLAMLEHLLSNPEPSALLIVGTCRSDELGPGIRGMLDRLAGVGTSIKHIRLSALSLSDTEALLADTLGSDRAGVRDLAKLVLGKTEGNPFHIRQLLCTIHDEGLFEHVAGQRTWRWHIDEVATCRAMDDLDRVLLRNLARLHPNALKLVQFAACLGDGVELRTLAAAAELDPLLALTDLWPAVERGVLSLERGMHEDPVVGEHHPAAHDHGTVVLRFRHARLHQSAAHSLGPMERARIHASMGRMLRRGLLDDEAPARLFEVALQLNAGRAFLEPAERWDLAELDNRCGRLAFETAAFASAIKHFEITIELLEGDPEVRAWDLRFTATLDRARAMTLSGRYAEAECAYAELLELAKSDGERLSVYQAQVQHALLITDPVGGFAACRRGLSLLGIIMPERDEDAREMYRLEHDAIITNLADRSAAEIATLPDLEDDELYPAPSLLLGLSSLTAFAGQLNVHRWVNCRMTNIALCTGSSKAATVAYARLSTYLADIGEYELARTLGELTLILCQRYDDPPTSGRALYAYLGFAACYDRPIAELLPLMRSAQQKCLESGDLMYAGYLSAQIQYFRLAGGCPLPQILADIEVTLPFLRRSVSQLLAGHYLPHIILPICDLMEIPLARFGVELSHDSYVAQYGWSKFLMSWYHAMIIKLDCLYGRPLDDDEMLRRLEIIDIGGLGNLLVRESRYYAILMLLAPTRTHPLDTRVREHIDAWRADLASRTARCPSNFGHLLALVDAELARTRGEPLDDTVSRYEQAIDEARLRGVTDQEALACWRFAEFWATRGSKRTALIYLATARDLYEAWGAARLVRILDARRQELQPPPLGAA
jgi:predicted ATPase/predicted Ser/Thr protein kinase